MDRKRLVSVVDDDESVRESLPDLLRQFGFVVESFASAKAFLASGNIETTDCLILDITMPGMSGPDLHRKVMRAGYTIPTIFITANGDGGDRPKVIRQGAVDCLLKPFSDAALLHSLRAVLPAL